MTVEFPSQKASNAENVSIWWRHHGNEKLSNAHEFVIAVSDTICSIHQSQMAPWWMAMELYIFESLIYVLWSNTLYTYKRQRFDWNQVIWIIR